MHPQVANRASSRRPQQGATATVAGGQQRKNARANQQQQARGSAVAQRRGLPAVKMPGASKAAKAGGALSDRFSSLGGKAGKRGGRR